MANPRELVKSVWEAVGAEFILFVLAFLLHLVLFSEKYGFLRNREPQKPRKKLTSTSVPNPNGNILAQSIVSLLNQAPELKVQLELLGNESTAEVQEIVATAGTDAELMIIQTAMQKGRSDVLRHFFASYPSPISGTNQVALLRRLVRKGYIPAALECLKTSPKTSLYAVVLEVLADKKDVEAVREAVAAATAANVADASCHNALIRVYGLVGQVEEAKKAVRAMVDAGIRPDTVTLSAFLEGIFKGGGCDTLGSCFAVLRDMKAYNLKPTSMTCSVLLKGIQKGSSDKNVEKVLQIMDEREDRSMDEVLLGSLCEALTRSGHLAMLVQRLGLLRKEGGQLQVKCAHTVGSIIRAYGSQEDIQGVWHTWNGMKRIQIQPTRITLGCMVEALAWNNDPEGAYKIIQDASKDPQTKDLVNAVMYSSVMKTFNHQKKYAQVWLIYEEMLREKIAFSVTTFNALIDVCARSGEIKRMELLLQDMVKLGIQPSIITYGTVIKANCSCNRLDDAFEVLEAMKRKNIAADEVMYNTILDGCARYGMFDRGMQVLDSMKASGVTPSNYTLSVLSKLANRSKRPEKAFELVDSVSKEFGVSLNMHVYNNLIQAATIQGDLVHAQRVFASMLNDRVKPDGRTFLLLLRASISLRAPAEAISLLRLALDLQLQEQNLDRELLAALKGLPNMSWVAAPCKGNGAMDEDVINDVFEYLSRLELTKRNPEQAIRAWRLLKEVQAAMPRLKVDVEIRTRLTSHLAMTS